MQIFRPFPSHEESAKFLDDARLNKQILESYQINNMIFKALGLIEGDSKTWFNHPVVRHVYNEGNPYLPDHWNYMWICNQEWLNRGRNRSDDFMNNMLNQHKIILQNSQLFNWESMPNIMRFGDKEIIGVDAYKYHRALLNAKWRYGKTVAKCSIKLKKGLIK